MNEEVISACRLCLKSNQDLDIIGDCEKDMIEIIVPQIKLAPSDDIQMCKDCVDTLQQSFIFKSKCLEIEDNIQDYKRDESDKIDLEIILGVRETGSGTCIRICRTCLKSLKNNAFIEPTETNGLKSMFQKCLPELDIESTVRPVICSLCEENLIKMFNFFTLCVRNEEKLKFLSKIDSESEPQSLKDEKQDYSYDTEVVLLTSEEIIKDEDSFVENNFTEISECSGTYERNIIERLDNRMSNDGNNQTQTQNSPKERPLPLYPIFCKYCNYKISSETARSTHIFFCPNLNEYSDERNTIERLDNGSLNDGNKQIETQKLLKEGPPPGYPIFCRRCSYKMNDESEIRTHMFSCPSLKENSGTNERDIIELDNRSLNDGSKQTETQKLPKEGPPLAHPIFCKHCNYKTNNETDIKAHIFSCPSLKKNSGTREWNIIEWFDNRSLNDGGKQTQTPEIPKRGRPPGHPIFCKYCNYVTNNVVEIRMHIFSCPNLNEYSGRKESPILPTEGPPPEYPLVCKYCNYVANNETMIRVHTFSCPGIGAKPTVRNSLPTRGAAQTSGKVITADECTGTAKKRVVKRKAKKSKDMVGKTPIVQGTVNTNNNKDIVYVISDSDGESSSKRPKRKCTTSTKAAKLSDVYDTNEDKDSDYEPGSTTDTSNDSQVYRSTKKVKEKRLEEIKSTPLVQSMVCKFCKFSTSSTFLAKIHMTLCKNNPNVWQSRGALGKAYSTNKPARIFDLLEETSAAQKENSTREPITLSEMLKLPLAEVPEKNAQSLEETFHHEMRLEEENSTQISSVETSTPENTMQIVTAAEESEASLTSQVAEIIDLVTDSVEETSRQQPPIDDDCMIVESQPFKGINRVIVFANKKMSVDEMELAIRNNRKKVYTALEIMVCNFCTFNSRSAAKMTLHRAFHSNVTKEGVGYGFDYRTLYYCVRCAVPYKALECLQNHFPKCPGKVSNTAFLFRVGQVMHCTKCAFDSTDRSAIVAHLLKCGSRMTDNNGSSGDFFVVPELNTEKLQRQINAKP